MRRIMVGSSDGHASLIRHVPFVLPCGISLLENSKELPFLDDLIDRHDDGEFSTSVYRKEVIMDLILSFDTLAIFDCSSYYCTLVFSPSSLCILACYGDQT